MENSIMQNPALKKPIIMFVIGLLVYLIGYFVHEGLHNAENPFKDNVFTNQNYKNRADWLDKRDSNLKLTEYMKTIGIVISVAGGVWLIVSAIQKNQTDKPS